MFADEDPQMIEDLVCRGVIDMVQLHGREDEAYIRNLRKRLGSPLIIQAFSIRTEQDAERADTSIADLILADSPGGETDGYKDKEKMKEFILAASRADE